MSTRRRCDTRNFFAPGLASREDGNAKCAYGVRVAATLTLGLMGQPVHADFSFSTGDPDAKIAVASRPDAGGKIEIEAGDDFLLTNHVTLTHATFTGLLSRGVDPSQIGDVAIENSSDSSGDLRLIGRRETCPHESIHPRTWPLTRDRPGRET